jgi:hypothetical protein
VETAPTEGRPVENAEVALSNGPSARSAGDGSFTISGVTAGTYTLTVTKADFTTTTQSVTVGSSDVALPRISLPAAPRIVSADYEGSLGPEEATCHGTSRSCDDYPVGAHNPGRVEAFLTWGSDETELDMELRCNNEVIEEALKDGGTTEELSAVVPGGQSCRIHVMHSGEKTNYRLSLKYPY